MQQKRMCSQGRNFSGPIVFCQVDHYMALKRKKGEAQLAGRGEEGSSSTLIEVNIYQYQFYKENIKE